MQFMLRYNSYGRLGFWVGKKKLNSGILADKEWWSHYLN